MKMSFYRRTALAPFLVATLLGLLSGVCSVRAEAFASAPESLDPSNQALRINGFGTLGVTSTFAPEGWYFRRDTAQYPPARSTAFDTDARLGVQAHYEVSPKLELASQILIKRRLPESKPLESVEWLFASYKPTGDVTLRVGRTNPDLFLLSDYRNVGVAYPWVRPNGELYGALPIYAIDGADASYVWTRDDTRWRAKAFWGTAIARATASYGPEQLDCRLHSAKGLLITRERDGLVMRATFVHTKMKVNTEPQVTEALDALNALRQYPDPTVAQEAALLHRRTGLATDNLAFYELGMSYDRGDWLWSAEYAQVHSPVGVDNAQSAYVSLGRRFGDFTWYGMVGRMVSRLHQVTAPDWSSLGPEIDAFGRQVTYGINASRTRQTSLALGTRWDFHPQMAAKFQLDHFWISQAGAGLWVGGGLQAAQPNVLSATLDFTF